MLYESDAMIPYFFFYRYLFLGEVKESESIFVEHSALYKNKNNAILSQWLQKEKN